MYVYMQMCVLGTKRCGALGFNVCKISIEISVFQLHKANISTIRKHLAYACVYA